ncbi:hypothetical protein FB45DRAFT_892572 [Roridomyces roridus]|uniref:Uncharacterized protein n=1 Tax=Roridomyces roridus TaxID=1738132 RepID=A0AAD7CFD9_9AGAR|nr:hypothetical protein FB45DRAFT_892572 [Roridomyces roridus]
MASRVRQAFTTTARTVRSRANVHPPRRFMSTDAGAHHEPFKPSSDMPWIIGAAALTVPALGYLLKDTMAIKARIAEGHHAHAHDSHDSHAPAHAEEEHAAPTTVLKDSEGTEADVSSAVAEATAADVPKAAPTAEESAPADDAAEPPKDEKEPEAEEEKKE